MNKGIIIMLIIALCILGSSTACSKETGGVKIITTYSGMAAFGYDPFNDTTIVSPPPLIIKNRDEYENFISMIPEYEMTPVSPAPPNDDPLLKKPEINFDTQMMLVIFSHDVNLFIPLKIEKVEIIDDTMIVSTWYETPDPDEIVSKIVDYGLYYAVVINSFDGEIVFREQET
jgi:hypothetical protein